MGTLEAWPNQVCADWGQHTVRLGEQGSAIVAESCQRQLDAPLRRSRNWHTKRRGELRLCRRLFRVSRHHCCCFDTGGLLSRLGKTERLPFRGIRSQRMRVKSDCRASNHMSKQQTCSYWRIPMLRFAFVLSSAIFSSCKMMSVVIMTPPSSQPHGEPDDHPFYQGCSHRTKLSSLSLVLNPPPTWQPTST